MTRASARGRTSSSWETGRTRSKAGSEERPLRQTPVIEAPRAFSRRAVCRPMSPVPSMTMWLPVTERMGMWLVHRRSVRSAWYSGIRRSSISRTIKICSEIVGP